MPAIRAHPLPPESLLARHSAAGDHLDCYTCDAPGAVGLGAFVAAFYTSRGFLPERLVLTLIGRGASLDDARRLARGEVDRFAAWRVEAREPDALLLRDFLGRTRSWLHALPLAAGGTRLHFGTGITRREERGLAARAENAAFRALLPGHAVYARVLLRAAVSRLPD